MNTTIGARSTTAKIIVVALCLLVAGFALLGCTGQGDRAGSDGAQTVAETRADAIVTQALPATITSHSNTYVIEDFTIIEDEDGNTVVSCTTSGFNTLPIKNNAVVIPVYCAAIEDGIETEFSSFSTDSESTDFCFVGKLSPDTVVFYPEDARDNRTEVPA